LKGGSHLCAPNYVSVIDPQRVICNRPSTSHVGFRCVVREPLASKSDEYIIGVGLLTGTSTPLTENRPVFPVFPPSLAVA
jgi:hypothetical protein